MQELLSTFSFKKSGRAPAAFLLFLLFLGGVEMAAAAGIFPLDFPYPRWLVPLMGEEVYSEDPAAGWRNIPYGRVSASTGGERLNSSGWRGPEWRDASETIRLACLGDSTTYGVLTPEEEDTYPRQLEKALRLEGECPECEVVNLGTNGFGTFQYELLTRTFFPAARVSTAIFYFGWADRTRMMGWFDYEERARFLQSSWGKSYLVRWFFRLTDPWVRELRYSRRLRKWFGPSWEKYGATWEQTEENLQKIVKNTRQAGILPIFMTTPWQTDSDLGPSGASIRAYNELIRRFARDYQIPLVDLEKKFAELIEAGEGPLFYADKMHPNPKGNEIISKELFFVIFPEASK